MNPYTQELTLPEQVKVWEKRALNENQPDADPDLQLVERVEPMPARMRQALDIGCGWGRHLSYLCACGWRPTGLDWSQEALNGARATLKAAGQHAPLVKGDFRTLPFSQGQFHLVIATNVLHHGRLADMRRALAQIKHVLAIGGTAVLSVPSIRNAPKLYSGNWVEEGTLVLGEGLEAGIPHHFYTYDELKTLTKVFRSAVIKAEYMPFPEGYQLLHEDQLNEWFWVQVKG